MRTLVGFHHFSTSQSIYASLMSIPVKADMNGNNKRRIELLQENTRQLLQGYERQVKFLQ
jgi:hypothetical protein